MWTLKICPGDGEGVGDRLPQYIWATDVPVSLCLFCIARVKFLWQNKVRAVKFSTYIWYYNINRHVIPRTRERAYIIYFFDVISSVVCVWIKWDYYSTILDYFARRLSSTAVGAHTNRTRTLILVIVIILYLKRRLISQAMATGGNGQRRYS